MSPSRKALLCGVRGALTGEGRHLAQEVLSAGPLEGAPAAAARPVAVDQRIIQVDHQRPHVPAVASKEPQLSWNTASQHCICEALSRVWHADDIYFRISYLCMHCYKMGRFVVMFKTAL